VTDGGALPRIVLGKDLSRTVRRGHPWIYRDALAADPALPDGAVVLVTTGDGRPLGHGFWSADAPIAVRMLTTDRAREIGPLVRARLRAALERRLVFLDLKQTNAFRWVHGEADLLPGLHLDLYAGHASLRFDGSGARAFYMSLDLPTALVAAASRAAGLRAVVERRRGARGGGYGGSSVTPPPLLMSGERSGVYGFALPGATPPPLVTTGARGGYGIPGGAGAAPAGARAPGVAPAVALVGSLPDGEIEVRENGLSFGVDLVQGQKGGLFLDQRENRERVRARARGRRVLNLFGYTGGFSVYAAAGGATHTTTVDMAAGAIAAAGRNLARNAAPGAESRAELVVADAFDFLRGAAADGARWDLVVSDPPSFAPRRSARPDALGAYRRLHRLCAAVTAPGGLLCAASCSSHVDEAAFLATVEAGCRDAGRSFRLAAVHGAAADHPIRDEFPEGRYLKLAIGEVG
jgi:23S rRNA (cytosine1962-C5)-methyltransferase